MGTSESNILRANLDALRRVDPELTARIEAVTPADLRWSISVTGLPTAQSPHRDGAIWLASRIDPLAEARKLLLSVDYQKHGGIFVLGVGLGYHVALAAEEMGRNTLMVVYEPNLAILRAALEMIDHRKWMGRSDVILLDRTVDRGTLVRAVERFASIVTQGSALVTHVPSRTLASADIGAFGQMVTDVLAYCRTNIATSMVNSTRTIRNLTANLAHYVAGANTNELHQIAKGYPAVCVGAGPSLAKNVQLLSDPAVRRNVIVIAAQTTLKPLLDRGIKPDFVTALDYSEISRRFYEGLPELPEVTLVAEPKAHPTVVDNYPGPIRVAGDTFLDKLMDGLVPAIIPIPHGATVAHLSFYLAQHLGCDPIILIGQDLGFSDGLYYCPGTAIHDVWAPELGQFNTVEMYEWQRIVRHRVHLSRMTDVHGRSIYTDEQMVTYLKQFERDFAAAPQKIIDATEGGLPKDRTLRMTLAQALATHATRPAPAIPRPARQLDPERLATAADTLRRRIHEATEIGRATRDTVPALQQLREHQRDMIRAEKLFNRIEKNRKKVDALRQTFNLVNSLNTVGAFKRARADRAIEHAGGDEVERQQLQIDRDLENLRWLAQSCDEANEIFSAALKRLDDAQKHARATPETSTIRIVQTTPPPPSQPAHTHGR